MLGGINHVQKGGHVYFIIIGFLPLLCLQEALGQLETNPELKRRMLYQKNILLSKQRECEEKNETVPSSEGLFCPPVWDGALCWPFVEAGTVANQSCPEYVIGFNSSAYATRTCTEYGSWFYREDKNVTWTNYSECSNGGVITGVITAPSFVIEALLEKYIPIIKIISRIGYSVSLVSLVIAVIILASIKKLRCPRNSVHLNLFASFIMRALTFLLKDTFFDERIHLNPSDNWMCKLFISLWQYCLMANYLWFLMEGAYIHTLIFFTVFSDNSGIALYVCLGWGMPLFFTALWVYARIALDNTLCWTVNDNIPIFWIIRGPITFSIVVNFLIFINIARILFLKLTSSQLTSSRGSRYRKLAKSTLILVPLFGIHYMFLLIMPMAAKEGSIAEIVWLICDQFFSSFQGFFVAVLYCFLNGEVQSELRKRLQRMREDKRCCYKKEWKFFHQFLNYCNRIPKNARFTNKRNESRRTSSYSRSGIPKDCTTNTTYFNNNSTPTTPKMDHLDESFGWGSYPANTDRNLSPLFDCSPVRDVHTPNGISVPHENLDASTVLTPMLKEESPGNFLSSPSREKLELLYLERMNSVDQNESSV